MPGMLLHIADRVINRPLLLDPAKAEIIVSVLAGRIGIETTQPAAEVIEPQANRFIGSHARAERPFGMARAQRGVALVSMVGSLVNRGAWIGANSGLTSYEGLSAQLRDVALDNEIHTVVMDTSSPGGEAGGMFEAAALVRRVAQTKRVIAFVDDVAASAAYGVISGAHEIIVSPTSIVGSIGVVFVHLDHSEELKMKGVKPTIIHAGAHKVDGNPFGPLSEAVREDLQKHVMSIYGHFLDTVALGRGQARFTREQARATEARTFIGSEAVKLGLADRVVSLDDLMMELTTTTARRQSAGHQQKGIRMDNLQNQPGATSGISLEQHNAAVSAAREEGIKLGASNERKRIEAICSHAEATGREKMAMTMALETEMTADAAAKVLAKSPKQVGATIAERAGTGAEIGTEATGAGATDKQAIAAAGWKDVVSGINKRLA